MTQLILPNYGIVDGNAFYVEPVVVGKVPAVGDKVACEAIPNTDGGMYEWRLLRVEVMPLLSGRYYAVYACSPCDSGKEIRSYYMCFRSACRQQ